MIKTTLAAHMKSYGCQVSLLTFTYQLFYIIMGWVFGGVYRKETKVSMTSMRQKFVSSFRCFAGSVIDLGDLLG